MTSVVDRLLSVPARSAYVVLALLVSARLRCSTVSCCRAGPRSCWAGFSLPLGRLSLPLLFVLVVVVAIVGDSVGYEVAAA